MIHITPTPQGGTVYYIRSSEGYLTFDAFDLNSDSRILFQQLKILGLPVAVNFGWEINENPNNKTLYSKFRKVAGFIITPWPIK